MNQITLIGNITKDSEMKYSKADKAIVTFSVAVNEGFGENKTTQFFNIVSFGAEKLCQYLTKGKTVAIMGKLSNSNWEKDGVKHYKTDIIANNFGGIEFVGGKSGGANNNNNSGSSNNTANNLDGLEPVTDDLMPF